MLTHIWGLMSPDVGRTENQKHKQYKLVLKSSELDHSLLPRLLCCRSSQPWASLRTGGWWVWPWGPTSGCRAARATLSTCSCWSSSALVLGRGFEKSECFDRALMGEGWGRWREAAPAGATCQPKSPFHLQQVWCCQGGSGPASLGAGWCLV